MVAMASLTLVMVVWMEEKSALIATCMCEDGINLIFRDVIPPDTGGEQNKKGLLAARDTSESDA